MWIGDVPAASSSLALKYFEKEKKKSDLIIFVVCVDIDILLLKLGCKGNVEYLVDIYILVSNKLCVGSCADCFH